MEGINKHEVSDDDVFTYRISKDDKVFICWKGRQIKVMKGIESRRFIDKINGLDNHEAQLVMAKATGNFKRGNER